MLLITARNIFTDDDDIADYEVEARVNLRRIWWGTVLSHPRKEKASGLLARIAAEMAKEGQ